MGNSQCSLSCVSCGLNRVDVEHSRSAHSTLSRIVSPIKERTSGDKVSNANRAIAQSLDELQRWQSEYDYLSKLTHFDADTIRLLHSRFSAIDEAIEKDNKISIEELASVLDISAQSLLAQRFFNFMDKSQMGGLNFRNFAIGMSMFSPYAGIDEKVKLSFSLFDLNNDGSIDADELTSMVTAASKECQMHLSNAQIAIIVDNTMKQADFDGNRVIDFEEYRRFCHKNPRILQPFQIDVEKLIECEAWQRRHDRYSPSIGKRKTLTHGPAQPNIDTLTALKNRIPSVTLPVERTESVHSISDPNALCADIESNDSFSPIL